MTGQPVKQRKFSLVIGSSKKLIQDWIHSVSGINNHKKVLFFVFDLNTKDYLADFLISWRTL